MAKDGSSVSLVILGIVAVLAVVGLVLLFSNAGASGNVVDWTARYGKAADANDAVASRGSAGCMNECVASGLDPVNDASSGAWGSCVNSCLRAQSAR